MASEGSGSSFCGWRIVGLALAVIAACLAWVFARAGWSDEGLHAAMRVTARSSFVLFLTAFSASSLAMFLPSATTRWHLANRRYFGVSFALSHLVHAGFILAMAARTGGGSLTGRLHDVLGGSFIYVFIVFMLVTSFDRTAAWVGPGSGRRCIPSAATSSSSPSWRATAVAPRSRSSTYPTSSSWWRCSPSGSRAE